MDATRQWWLRIRRDMAAIGWEGLTTEFGFWVRRDQSGKVLALAHVHVDDFLAAHDPQNAEATQCFETVCGLYEWGLWESADFVQCGVRIRQSVDRYGRWGAIRVDMAHYAEELEAVPIPPMRRKRPDLPLTKPRWLSFAVSVDNSCGLRSRRSRQ